LQDNLRKLLWSRIEQGELTGLELAEQSGFQQAHISNFLNRKRSLSLAGLDKVLAAQGLSVFDLLDAKEMDRRASPPPAADNEFENIFLVEPETAARGGRIRSADVLETAKFRKSFLRRLRPELEGGRDGWDRFVLLRAGAREGMSMYPRLLPGAIVLVDRHYNSLKPYRRNEINMYAVRTGNACTLKQVELSGRSLLLRPQNPAYPVEVLAMAESQPASDYLIGRICHVALET
jgi:transcriptional regulator with XRE-family HTH domain